MTSAEELVSTLSAAHQQPLLSHLEALSPTKREVLTSQIRSLAAVTNLLHLQQVFHTTMKALNDASQSKDSGRIEPPLLTDVVDMTVMTDENERESKLRVLGLDALSHGKVAVLVLAGGSGTRLGQSFPKGMLVCDNMVIKKSLFEMQCEKVRRMEAILRQDKSHETRIPYVVMTSQQTDAPTKNFFSDNQYFGLDPSQIFFFSQSSLPCFSMDGHVLLEEDDRIATAPGGNAGVYEALAKSGGLTWLADRGVSFVQIVTIDNLLVQLPDPVMVGAALEGSEAFDVVVKTVPKANDEEAVGVFAKKEPRERSRADGSLVWGVVEYTELPTHMAKSRAPDGTRLFDHGNIAVHLLSLPFLRFAAEKMATYEYYHAAIKAIPTVEGTTKGVKLEAFIFDIFEFAKTLRILKVARSEEFSPIKNADDAGHNKPDSPFTALRDMRALHTKWAAAAGLPTTTGEGSVALSFEISPLVSLRGEGLAESASDWIVAINKALQGGDKGCGTVVVALRPTLEVAVVKFEAPEGTL